MHLGCEHFLVVCVSRLRVGSWAGRLSRTRSRQANWACRGSSQVERVPGRHLGGAKMNLEEVTFNPSVLGSNPRGPTTFKFKVSRLGQLASPQR